MSEGVAQLTGAATAPAHRRCGAQNALLSVRLADAAAAGCDLAVVESNPDTFYVATASGSTIRSGSPSTKSTRATSTNTFLFLSRPSGPFSV